jgi:hypothetical protein
MKFIFLAALPKSGTTLAAGLMAKVENVAGQHEYIGNRPADLRAPYLQLSWYLGREYAVPYLQRVRRAIEAEFDAEYFCDVGAGLQRSAPFLEEVFEPEAIFHLVRDPRNVVRSLYTHRTEQTDRQLPLMPKSSKEIDEWLAADKFAHICMQWAETTRFLVETGAHLIRLENLVSDYGYFRSEVLERCNLTLSEADWHEHVKSRVNPTPSRFYRFARAKIKRRGYVPEQLPPYDQWPPSRQREFDRICGDAMAMVGYAGERAAISG